MARRIAGRKNDTLLKWLRAFIFAGMTSWALLAMAFDPPGAAVALGAGVGILALISTGLAVLAAIILLAIPMLAADLIVGAAFLVVGFAAVQYLSQQNGRLFLLIAGTFVAAALGPIWAVPVIAGYLLGSSEGAIVSLLACLLLEGAGIIAGHGAIGAVVTGGMSPAMLAFGEASGLLSFGWVGHAVESLSPGGLLDSLGGVNDVPMLLAQPLIWAVAASITGLLKRNIEDPKRTVFGLVAAVSGIAAAAFASIVAVTLLGSEAELPSLGLTAGMSLAVALAYVGIWEYVFPPIPPKAIAPRTNGLSSMQAEDADVDDLLRLISTAEDQLSSKHTTQAVVMITDMKSFSRMTEEDGSFLSAKAIQRHRDLLLPVIARHAGSGKSTGGDGLVASFKTALDATTAAADIQRAILAFNTEHLTEREMSVRVGIASGEVVLDKGGRPFIGNALNMAARVMDLGDGGQVLVTREVKDLAGQGAPKTHSHGSFELKNIAEPVEVFEILWSDDLTPVDPRTRKS
ncbi:MAG: adenylate/guanylate cyclase domain-containing protein [Actinomycetota bacterium]|jgi:class 3 adenylate cyclase|nr:adenylate/guanylate cyclase domain-containing protein [Actinomycetota bacterium]